MSWRVFFLAMIPLLFQPSCSLLGARRQVGIQKTPTPEIRDIPYSTRPLASTYTSSSNEILLKKRIMVLPFLSDSDRKETGLAARSAFLQLLHQSRNFVVIANRDFPKDLESYRRDKEYDIAAIAKVAAGMGVAAVIDGRVLEIKARRIGDEVGLVRQVRAQMEAKIQLRVVNTRNGSIVLTETREAETEGAVTRVAERAETDRNLSDDPGLVQAVINRAFAATVPRLISAINKLSWEGRVALVRGERVYLNAGRISGLQIGDILRISESGEDVHDPETGSYIGRVPGRLKGTVEVVSYFGKDGAIAILHSGSGFRENDLVELY